MKYLPLIFASLFRRKTRTILTLLSIIVAFVLYGLLQAISVAFNRGVEISGADRIITQGRYSLTEVLPISYYPQLQQMEGVVLVTHAQWFGGVYQEPKNFFPQFAVEPASYLDMYPEFLIPVEQRAKFIATRDGAIVGKSLAERFKWKIGDRIPIQATIWPKADGSNNWEFELVGIFEGKDEATRSQEGALLFQYDYFEEARQFGKGTTGIYITRVADPGQYETVAQAIDARYRNSERETKTGSEKAFNASFIKQMGDIGLIVTSILGAVFFTILLVTANTMAQSVRERIPEIAILKTIGFSDQTALGLVLAEALLLCGIGGLLGMALVQLIMPGISKGVGEYLPGLGLNGEVWLLAAAIAIGLGIVTGLLPALKAQRLRIVDALSGHQ